MAPISEEEELADALRAWGVPDGRSLESWMNESSIISGGCSRPASAAEQIRGLRPSSSTSVLQRSQSSAARPGGASRPPSRGGIQRPNSRASSRGETKRQVWLDPAEQESSPLQLRSNRPAALDVDKLNSTPSASRPPSRAASQPSLGSRPGSRQTTRPASRGTPGGAGDSSTNASHVSKPSSQRFSPEELQCFRKLPTPSAMYEEKSQTYFQTVGVIRNELVESNWHLLPVLKGEFYQHPQLKDCNSPTAEEKKARARERIRRLQEEKKKREEADTLPDEARVASVLNVIFPRNPKEPVEERQVSGGGDARKQSVDMRSDSKNKGRKVRSDSTSFSPKHAANSRDASGSPKAGRAGGGFPARGAKRGPPGAGAGAGAGIGSAPADASAGDARKAMVAFRARLLEHFCTLKEAFDTFARELPAESRSISKRELAVVLAHHGFEWPTREERDVVFDQLDFKGDGHMILNDFHISLEASAPVRTIEDLRRRWLASGFGSMMQPITLMTYGSMLALTNRLSFQDFAERLSRVHVTDSSEHVAVHNAICVDRKKREVSVAELACAVAVVSPGLLMEDLRERLIRRFAGDLGAAFADLDMDEGGEVDTEEFCLRACGRLQLSEVEATKAFREIDIDASGTISRSELVCAIGLSEPSLFLEDLRVKVRQRFHSFHSQLAGAFQQSITSDLGSAPQLTLQRFQELLFPLDMSETETMALFSLIDADGDGTLTVQEFIRGIAHFAPSATLEDLRQRCYQRHSTIDDAFAGSTVEHTKLIDIDMFTRQLVELELYDEPAGNRKLDEDIIALQAGVRPQAIFDLLDVANRGEVTLARLVAALQSCGSGASVKLTEDDLKLKAKQDVRADMAPMHRLITDLKQQARQGMRYNEGCRDGNHVMQDECWGKSGTRIVDAMLEQAETRGCTKRETKMSKFLKPGQKTNQKNQGSLRPRQKSQDLGSEPAGKSATPRGATAPGKTAALGSASEDRGGGPPKLKAAQYQDHAGAQSNLRPNQSKLATRPVKEAASGAQRSWQRVWTHLHHSPGQQQRISLEMGLQGYFQSASTSLAADGPLVHGSEQSRMHAHESMRTHQTALKSNLKGQASP